MAGTHLTLQESASDPRAGVFCFPMLICPHACCYKPDTYYMQARGLLLWPIKPLLAFNHPLVFNQLSIVLASSSIALPSSGFPACLLILPASLLSPA